MVKKILCCVVTMLCLVSVIYSEENLIEGYRNLPWKSSLEDVLKEFPDAKSDDNFEDNSRESHWIYTKGNFSVLFIFYDNQLAAVEETYSNQNEKQWEKLFDEVKNKYGNNFIKDSSATEEESAYMFLCEKLKDTLVMVIKNKTKNELFSAQVRYVSGSMMFFL